MLALGLPAPKRPWQHAEQPLDVSNLAAVARFGRLAELVAGVDQLKSAIRSGALADGDTSVPVSGPEYQIVPGVSLTEGGCAASADIQIRWNELDRLATWNALDLGCTSWQVAVAAAGEELNSAGNKRVRLSTCLSPDDQIGEDCTMTAVRSLFFSDWERNRPSSWSTVSHIIQMGAGAAAPGLNADDRDGPFYRGVLYALSLLYTYAELGDRPFGKSVKYSPQQFRKDVDGGLFRVHIGWSIGCNEATVPGIVIGGSNFPEGSPCEYERAGSVRVGSTVFRGATAWAFFDIFLCDTYAVHASLADYYFWWSRRLLTRASSGKGDSLWYTVLAWCAAKAALAEIVEIAGVILHEYGHIKVGGGDHCLAAFDEKLACGMYLDQGAFKCAVSAKLALPRPQFDGGQAIDPYSTYFLEFSDARRAGRALQRFDYQMNDGWDFTESVRPSADVECSPRVLVQEHCRFWDVDHEVRFSWQIQTQNTCFERESDRNGSVTFHGGCGWDTPATGGGFQPQFGLDGPESTPPWFVPTHPEPPDDPMDPFEVLP